MDLQPRQNSTLQETKTIVRLQYTDLRLNHLYIAITCWVYLVVMYIIPFIILFVLNWRFELYIFNRAYFHFIKNEGNGEISSSIIYYSLTRFIKLQGL